MTDALSGPATGVAGSAGVNAASGGRRAAFSAATDHDASVVTANESDAGEESEARGASNVSCGPGDAAEDAGMSSDDARATDRAPDRTGSAHAAGAAGTRGDVAPPAGHGTSTAAGRDGDGAPAGGHGASEAAGVNGNMTRPGFGSAASAGHGGMGGNVGIGGAGGADMMGAAGAGASAPPHPGPMIDVHAIPVGDPGVGDIRIRATDYAPQDDDEIGAFRTICRFSHMNFDDPIVAPRQSGVAHLHAYFGNTSTNAASTSGSIANSGNSTCDGGIANRTAYWVPVLIGPDGVPATPGDASIYYKTGYNGIAPSQVHALPAGLRMIAGNSHASATQDEAYWGCEDHYVGHLGSLPDCPRGDRVVMTVVFPQCWDGTHLDSSDHKSHMAYVQDDGHCPVSHPVAVPEITFNVPYTLPNSSGKGFRLSSDMYDPALQGGFSAHADWFNGWRPDIMAIWIERCDRPSRDCHSDLLGDGRELWYSLDPD